MTLTQLAPPYPIFTDKSGTPLDNGYLYFGTANLNPETNPITVYYDSLFTQPAAQPLRTSNGYVMRNGSPALIYANSQFSVTVRDKNKAMVIYSPIGYGFVPGTTASNTDQMTYNEGSAGAVTRVLTTRLQDYISVKDFGAVGDGVTNDTAAMQAALNTGGDVLIPDGYTFLITSSLTIATTNLRKIYGSGKIKQGANNINCIDASGAQNVTVDGVQFEGYAATIAGTDVTKNQAVYANIGRNIVVRNCIISGFSFSGVQFRNVFDAIIESNLLYNNYYDNASGSDILLYSNTDSSGTIIRNNRCHSNNSQAIYVNAVGGDRDVLVEGNICYTLNSTTWAEITDYSAAAGTYRNSTVYLQRRHGIIVGYASAADLAGRFIVANNNIRSTQWSGIYRALTNYDPGPATVIGNMISNVSMQSGAAGSLEGGILLLCYSAGDIYDSNQIISVGNGNNNKAGIKIIPGASFSGSLKITKNTIKTASMGIWISGYVGESVIISQNSLYDFYQNGGVYYAPSNQNATINTNLIIRDNLIDGFNGAAWSSAAISLEMGSITIPQIIEISGGSIHARTDTSLYGIGFRNLKTTDSLAIGDGIAIAGVENAIWNESYGVGRFPGLRFGRVTVTNSRNRATCEAFNMGYNGGVNGSAFALVEAGGAVYQGVTTVVDARGGTKALYQGRWLDNERVEAVHTGVPTTGCWVRGDVVLYSSPSAASAPGSVCVTSGQFGNMSGITAATTATSTTVTFSASTGLAIGMSITIVGVTGTKKIVSLSGTTAVVDVACDATVAAGAVAYVTPVFKALASVAA